VSGNISVEELDRILLGMDALLIVATRLTETSNMIKVGGEDGISDDGLAIVKEKAGASYSKFSALVDELSAKKES